MFEILLKLSWIKWLELIATIAGLLYIYLSLKQKVWSWPVAILGSILFIPVFFFSEFYSHMGLQFYYVFIGFYGWYLWLKGSEVDDSKQKLPVTFTTKKTAIYLILITVTLFIAISLILKYLTKSPLPILEALTFAGSIVATWMLAKKHLEHWLVWVVVNIISIGIYLYQDLYITVILYVTYLIMAIVGYFKWKNEMKII